VPLLHLLEHAWQSQGDFEQFKELGNYLFPNLGDALEAVHCGVADEDIFEMMKEHAQGNIFL